MSDNEYTPTTLLVRSSYAVCRAAENDRPEARAEFDRWLAAHDREVAAKALTDAAEHITDDYLKRALLARAAAVPGGESNGLTYVVCDRLLDAETNEHCEFDGRVAVDARGYWQCPGCGARRYGTGAGGES